ncbi:MAG: 3-dehydroquinate synthase [Kordiimonadaceae bacterium]|nr:3-dehydroquinate synthase [Kordiimonadaceae bacterium]MBO6568938.1 3-dehydroquinate synthase [Kordiimonadaceae bacterium]MBO6965087.1 3-dehydroquinate synthase [Kordiimonadaceae bacterium]
MSDATPASKVAVALGERAYDIHIGAGLLDRAGEILLPFIKNRRVFVVSEKNVIAHHGDTLKTALAASNIESHWFVQEPGETSKSFSVLERLVGDILGTGIERSDVLVAFGGGVIGDLAGFAASTILRGIDFVQIPTTLLSQVDSSVGGKTGINTAHGKNLVGAFYQPKAVLIDTNTLNTLPRRELLAGYAEVVKYGVIDDPEFFAWLEDNGADIVSDANSEETQVLRTNAIAHSCRAKARVVAEDEREAGKRALLNLGHTFGHALEAECGYSGKLLHGEAVAIGMVIALDASVRLGLASPNEHVRVKEHFDSVGMRTSAGDIGLACSAEDLLAHMGKDKKVEAGTIGFILGGIGTAAMHRGVDLEIIKAVLQDSLDA